VRLPTLFLALLASAPPDIAVRDRPAARIVDVALARHGEGLGISGSVQGRWLKTADRRTISVEAFDATGASLGSGKAVARLFARAPSNVGVDTARFEIALPGGARAARAVVSVQSPSDAASFFGATIK
jgi:hypothetical protein